MCADLNPNKAARLGASGWLAMLVLLAMLAAAVCYCIYAWRDVPSVGIPRSDGCFLRSAWSLPSASEVD